MATTKEIQKKIDGTTKRLHSLKTKAYNLGVAMHSVSDLCKAVFTGQGMTGGDRAEIVMAYLLGFFKKLTEDDGWGEIIISFSPFLDKKKVDFVVTRFGWDHKIQMKFNDLRRYVLPRGVYLIRTAPPRHYRSKNFMRGKTDRGDNVLLEFLAQSDVCTEEQLYDFFEAHENFAAVCCEAWELIHD